MLSDRTKILQIDRQPFFLIVVTITVELDNSNLKGPAKNSNHPKFRIRNVIDRDKAKSSVLTVK
jgi:hypothetical protein